MSARVTRGNEGMDEASIRAAFARDGLNPTSWSNSAGDRYGSHSHPYHKVLYCVRGSITFRLATGDDLALEPGDRLDIEPGTAHSAIVGLDGVTCMEAARPA